MVDLCYLPQVYSEHPNYPGNPLKSNLGMYRVQLSGNEYLQDKEIGIHYQIHRGIGVHQKRHQEQISLLGSQSLWWCTFDGFFSCDAFPEGLPEVAFSGLMAGRIFDILVIKIGQLQQMDLQL